MLGTLAAAQWRADTALCCSGGGPSVAYTVRPRGALLSSSSSMVLTSTETIRLIRDGRRWEEEGLCGIDIVYEEHELAPAKVR